jgi:transcriptional regulator with XRE-family HTH domain
MLFGKALFAAREEAYLHQPELASKIGVHYSTIQTWESGSALPSEPNYDALMTALPSLQSFPRPKNLAKGRPGRPPAKPYASPTSTRTEPVVAPSNTQIDGHAQPLMPDPLISLDQIINAYETIGMSIVPRFDISGGLRVVSLVDKDTNECIGQCTAQTTSAAVRGALAAVTQALATKVDAAGVEMDAAVRKFTVLKSAQRIVCASIGVVVYE